MPAVTFFTQDNAKLVAKLKSRFKETNNESNYQSNPEQISQNPIINQLIYPSFQGVNRLFVLSFENTTDKTTHTGYNLLKVKIKDCNVTIDKRTFLPSLIKITNIM